MTTFVFVIFSLLASLATRLPIIALRALRAMRCSLFGATLPRKSQITSAHMIEIEIIVRFYWFMFCNCRGSDRGSSKRSFHTPQPVGVSSPLCHRAQIFGVFPLVAMTRWLMALIGRSSASFIISALFRRSKDWTVARSGRLPVARETLAPLDRAAWPAQRISPGRIRGPLWR